MNGHAYAGVSHRWLTGMSLDPCTCTLPSVQALHSMMLLGARPLPGMAAVNNVMRVGHVHSTGAGNMERRLLDDVWEVADGVVVFLLATVCGGGLTAALPMRWGMMVVVHSAAPAKLVRAGWNVLALHSRAVRLQGSQLCLSLQAWTVTWMLYAHMPDVPAPCQVQTGRWMVEAHISDPFASHVAELASCMSMAAAASMVDGATVSDATCRGGLAPPCKPLLPYQQGFAGSFWGLPGVHACHQTFLHLVVPVTV